MPLGATSEAAGRGSRPRAQCTGSSAGGHRALAEAVAARVRGRAVGWRAQRRASPQAPARMGRVWRPLL